MCIAVVKFSNLLIDLLSFSFCLEYVSHSGGRDLSGNKRTNKDQSFDQKFEKSNEALRVSCKMGYPVRVVRFVKAISLNIFSHS